MASVGELSDEMKLVIEKSQGILMALQDARMRAEAFTAPLRFEGGDIHAPCGSWGTDDPAAARRLVAECPPLTKGDL